MIGSLRGTVLERMPPGELLVEVGGVGYRAVVAPTVLASVDPGATVLLYTHLHVREDALTLYGFLSRDERGCFEALIGAHGVGPALALAILSVHTPDGLRRALAEGDVDALCLVPGVGKRTAARLLVELQARLDLPDLDLTGDVVAVSSTARSEVREALTQLGYDGDEIREVLRDLPDGDGDTGAGEGDTVALLREALQRLAGAR